MGLDTRYDSLIKFGKLATYNEGVGTWSESGTLKEQICRASPSGTGGLGSSKFVNMDGSRLEYSFDIAFPFGTSDLPKAGDDIEIYGTGGGLIFKGKLIRIHYGSYSIRAWA